MDENFFLPDEKSALGLEEVRFVADLLLILVQMLQGSGVVSGLLDYGVLVQEQLAVLVVVSGFLQTR